MNSQSSSWFHRVVGDEAVDTSAHDMSTLCQSTEGPNLSTSSCSETQPTSTKVLHEGESDKPAITLTAYKDLLPSPHQYLLQIFEPSNPGSALAHEDDDNTIGSLTSALESTSLSARREKPEMMLELDDHFRSLKSEFETRQGRSWAPLRALAKEEWD
jgi:hypothetical protein